MKHELYDIWQAKVIEGEGFGWRLQLENYIAYFASRKEAEEYAKSVQKECGRASR